MKATQLRSIIREEISRYVRSRKNLSESRGHHMTVAQSVIEWIGDIDEVDYKLSELETELPSAVLEDGMVDPGALSRNARNMLITITGELGCSYDACPADDLEKVMRAMRSALS